MRAKINSGAAWFCLLAGVAAVLGGLVWAAFGRNHTKVVTRTVTVEHQVVADRLPPRWNGTPQGLANYMKPKQAKQVPCPKGVSAGVSCFVFVSDNFYATLAVPSS